MNAAFTLLACVILGCAAHLLLSRDLFRVLLGAMMLTNGANLAVIAIGGTQERTPAFVHEHALTITASEVANPLPQALVLTAIVIGLAIFAFVLALVVPLVRKLNTLDVDLLLMESPEHNPSGSDISESNSP
jgi:multicomponent Na+:H+ antiporter subunit C